MAKEKENKKGEKQEAAPAVATVDNVREMLDKASLGRQEQAQAALEKLKKDHDEHTQREMATRFEEASYQIDRGLLNLRRERDIAKITQGELIQRDRLARYLMGYTLTEETISNSTKNVIVKIDGKEIYSNKDIFGKEETFNEKEKTVTILVNNEKKTFKLGEAVPPVIDYVDYDDLKKKIKESTNNAMDLIEKEHSKYSKKLDAKYDRYWQPSWRW